MPIPDYQSLMLPVLEVAAKAETTVPLAEAEIATKFGLSDEEREQMLPSGKQRVSPQPDPLGEVLSDEGRTA